MKTQFSFWDFDKYPELEGEFVGKYPHVGPFKKGVFVVKRKEGGIVHLWGFVKLNNLMHGLPFGTKILVKYLGRKPMPDNENNKFKDFSVDILEEVPEKPQKT